MSDQIDKLAAEAWDKLHPCSSDPEKRKRGITIIQAVIEKAVKPYSEGWLDQAARDSAEIVRLETIIESLEATNIGCPSKWPKGYKPQFKDGAYRWVSDESRAAHASEQEAWTESELDPDRIECDGKTIGYASNPQQRKKIIDAHNATLPRDK